MSENRLNPGDAAPDFTLPATGGREIRLSDLKGQKVVLYFYPKDDTSGCTTQACGVRKRNAISRGSMALARR